MAYKKELLKIAAFESLLHKRALAHGTDWKRERRGEKGRQRERARKHPTAVQRGSVPLTERAAGLLLQKGYKWDPEPDTTKEEAVRGEQRAQRERKSNSRPGTKRQTSLPTTGLRQRGFLPTSPDNPQRRHQRVLQRGHGGHLHPGGVLPLEGPGSGLGGIPLGGDGVHVVRPGDASLVCHKR